MRFIIAGYYGFGNAGDELILRSLCAQIKMQSPSAEITVLSSDPGGTASEHGVSAVDRWSPLKVLRAVGRSDVLLFGGGGLLQDSTGTLGLWYYLLILWTGILLGKRTVVHAVGFGPIRSSLNRSLAVFTLRRVQSLRVRDSVSAGELRSLGIKEIGLSSDPVLALPAAPRRVENVSTFRIGVVVRGEKISGPWVRILSEAAKILSGRLKASVTVVPFHIEMDRGSVREFKADFGDGCEVFEWRSLDELLEGVRGFDIILTMRLHAAVLGAMAVIPAVAVAVDPKIKNFLEELGLEFRGDAVGPEPCSASAVAELAVKLWEKRFERSKLLSERMPALKERAVLKL